MKIGIGLLLLAMVLFAMPHGPTTVQAANLPSMGSVDDSAVSVCSCAKCGCNECSLVKCVWCSNWFCEAYRTENKHAHIYGDVCDACKVPR